MIHVTHYGNDWWTFNQIFWIIKIIFVFVILIRYTNKFDFETKLTCNKLNNFSI